MRIYSHSKSFFLLPLLFLVMVFVTSDAGAKKITTRLNVPKVVKPTDKSSIFTAECGEEFDNVAHNVIFFGYDKKASATKESFLIKNESASDIFSIEIEISYFTTTGNLIHKRTAEVKTAVPSGETRIVDIPSWDTQKSYHYIYSTPSQKGSTPYTVRFHIISFSL